MMLLEGIIAVASGVGIYGIGQGIYQMIVVSRKPSRKSDGEIEIPLRDPIPWNDPYRTNANPLDGSALKSPDIIKWAWKHDTTPMCHMCPKCHHYQRTDSQTKAIVPKICECTQYHKSHFHFECYKCDYKAIMRTADDKEEKKEA